MVLHPSVKLDQSTSRLLAIAKNVISHLLLAPDAKLHL
jgi:hypothetical protein